MLLEEELLLDGEDSLLVLIKYLHGAKRLANEWPIELLVIIFFSAGSV